MGRIILGIIITLTGALLAIKTHWVYNFTGPVAWAEKYLGVEGGTRLFYKLLGILAILIGLATITGLISGFLEGLVRFVFPIG